jgi:hypothetical protein
MPPVTLRWSLYGQPRPSTSGRRGSIRAYCSSVSPKRQLPAASRHKRTAWLVRWTVQAVHTAFLSVYQTVPILRKLARLGFGIEPEGPSEETPRRKDVVFLFGAERVVDQVLRKSAEAVVDLQQRSPFEEKLSLLLRHRNIAEIRSVVRAVGSCVSRTQEATYTRICPPVRRR